MVSCCKVGLEVERGRFFELEPSWQRVLGEELKKPYIAQLAAFESRERALGAMIYPPEELVFNALWQTPYDRVKVVILGQDPYHGPGQAHGLCFSVPRGVPAPPSLQNIFKELASDVGISQPDHGCLIKWAEQGVLLLNAVLSVRQSEPLSHQGKGWEEFTDAMIRQLCEREEPLAFLLWGKYAQDKCRRIAGFGLKSNQLLLKAPHPSPLSAHNGFFGCRHFSQANQWLAQQGQKPIDWSL